MIDDARNHEREEEQGPKERRVGTPDRPQKMLKKWLGVLLYGIIQ
jgi:hypothetical protein